MVLQFLKFELRQMLSFSWTLVISHRLLTRPANTPLITKSLTTPTTTMLLLTLLPFFLVSTLTTAASLIRTLCTCTCTSPTHRGYTLTLTFTFTFTPHPSTNSTPSYTIYDKCVSEMGPGGCNEDVTYLEKYTITQNNHTSAYHRNLFGPDEYDFDGRGKQKVLVREAHELGDRNVTE
jgi:hypothetical protein